VNQPPLRVAALFVLNCERGGAEPGAAPPTGPRRGRDRDWDWDWDWGWGWD